ncbi:hypothetical protein [Paenarthrobacter sp. C1]|uniref:hypothetical protein n=1 Tax=Paenarthrobacter sp. C1 TaxID=3400220 RepID=UPI003BF4FA66
MADPTTAPHEDATGLFPRDTTGPTTYYEIWEYHGETPMRRVALGIWERGYVKQDQAEEDATKLAADPRWTQFKTEPSFRVITVTVTRTPTGTPAAVPDAALPDAAPAGEA